MKQMKKFTIITISLVLLSLPAISQTRRSRSSTDRKKTVIEKRDTRRSDTQTRDSKERNSGRRSIEDKNKKSTNNRNSVIRRIISNDTYTNNNRRRINNNSRRLSNNPGDRATLNDHINRPVRRHRNTKPPLSLEIRRVRFPYRVPARVEIFWTPHLIREYHVMYPSYRHWNIRVGMRIGTISSYDSYYHIGEVRRVFGKVEDTYYCPITKQYYLYFGADFPYHDFSVVIPRRIAKRFSRVPSLFFFNEHLCVTGLITAWQGKPEIIIRKTGQIEMY